MIRFKTTTPGGKAPEEKAPAPARPRDMAPADEADEAEKPAKKPAKPSALSKAGRAARAKAK
jgi:hypothetical protein